MNAVSKNTLRDGVKVIRVIRNLAHYDSCKKAAVIALIQKDLGFRVTGK